MTTVIINKHLCLHISKYIKFLSFEVEMCMRDCEPMKHSLISRSLSQSAGVIQDV